MGDLNYMGKVLVIAPHPDDEILGCGGTMARLAKSGAEVVVAIVTRGMAPQFSDEFVANIRAEAKISHALVGVSETLYLDLPAAALETVPAMKLNGTLAKLVQDVRPDTMFVPFVGDIHTDHQLTFLAAMVAARPRDIHAPRRIYAYETLSETNWYAPGITPAFVPNIFIDITETLELKLDAFRCFESQVKAFPDERSIEAIRALATMRGASMYLKAAEAFMLIRQIDS
ncbi:PIG-L family deacetylase [Sphingorhabdus sp. IMCC26285]|uniref:PIG-L family deacetylase n=1 Tax=Sphingorhabdus profundilacus TaxID=2509718 RepID=A0A6I4M6G0_9SPHN|nr:PIG-L deacetylase family protein [Sphingorhabdus profundilacus]MVZ98258.1 PIG-L family deacetylase [Sphingorhabdus profundilacus]